MDTLSMFERQALMENVYPRLYLHCKQRGCDFKMVDLRLGVGDPLCQKHDTVELHMDMLRQCQETEGPDLFVSQLCCALVIFNDS
uniref:Uncharacterized protein n=1 Tax=Denticeps clupeoides TaxID=299321 RepID=A0AAY4A1T2_9TELE